MAVTGEQRLVIDHPRGHHARVVAVAGSGKTTTMALRIRDLVGRQGVDPRTILVLMYNRLARLDFQARLAKVGIPAPLHPKVHTFHSFAFGFNNQMVKRGLLPALEAWTEDKDELVRITTHQAIQAVRRALPRDDRDPVDVGTAMEAISLWKGSLIPPKRAGYRGDDRVPAVYAEFEHLRLGKRGLTFDDFVPTTVGVLESNPAVAARWCNQHDVVIVDEYQDVNLGQQRLVELIAGDRADVMVVGDDDQTIYEWRGARPSYIIREFKTVFANKPHTDYALTRTFRFGPLLAQAAQNVIAFNTTRVPKDIVAESLAQPAQVVLLLDLSEQPTDVDKEMAEQIQALLRDGVPATRVAALARMSVQLDGLQAALLDAGVPFRLENVKPFYERREIRTLLAYVSAAAALPDPMTEASSDAFLKIANMPSRKLAREKLERAATGARQRGLSLAELLDALVHDLDSPFITPQRDAIAGLLDVLRRLRERVLAERAPAGRLLAWLVEELSYLAHFDDYFGTGEDSNDRRLAVESFLAYAERAGVDTLTLMADLERFDPSQGRPPDEQVLLTTIFRTKGLEYDHVFLPRCEEGYVPCLYGAETLTYDKEGLVAEPETSEAVENERRLFYVGLTRARDTAYIGASVRPATGGSGNGKHASRFIEELQLSSVRDVMAPFQSYAAGDANALAPLRDGLARSGGVGWIKRTLVANYLGRLGQPGLVADVSALIAALPEAAFGYAHAYASVRPPRSHQTAPPVPVNWWEEDIPL